MAKKKKKSNFKDTSAEQVGNFGTVEEIVSVLKSDQVDLEDMIEEEEPEEISTGQIDLEDSIKEVEKGDPKFKTINHVKLKDTVTLITNQNLTEKIKQDLINNHGYSEDDFIY
jgi:exonuclease VII small subunit